MDTILSIVIPSRNRQSYALQTLTGLGDTMVPGVEVILCDNSDQHDLLPSELVRAFPSGLPDWLTFIPSSTEVLSMRANWQRALESTAGDWVTYIGDDDFVDPSVALILARLVTTNDTYDYFTWSQVKFVWPDAMTHDYTIEVDLGHELKPWPKEAAWKSFWTCGSGRPPSMFTPYHGAVRRRVIEKVAELINTDGVYFKHSNTDYITGWLGATVGGPGAYSQRPLSVIGTSKASNGFQLREPGGIKHSLDRYISDLQKDAYLVANPLDSISKKYYGSVTEYFYDLGHDFIKHVKEFNGYQGQWKENLVKNGLRELDAIPFEQSHAEVKRSLQKFFSGLGVKLPDVTCNPMITKESLARGYYDNKLIMDSHPFGVTTPFELYKCLNDFLYPVRRIGLKIEKRKRG